MGNAAWRLSAEDPSDPTFYPSSDNMGEDAVQRDIAEMLRPLLIRYLAERGIQAYVGADQFIYWEKGNPRACVAPDVYVMPGLSQRVAPRCWKIWQTGIVPSFALEVLSEENEGKDVDDGPQRYEALGVEELVLFDPYVDVGSGRTRFRRYRRDGGGKLARVEATNEDRVRSEVLGCYLRAEGERPELRLRIATGPRGETLVPTAEERAAAAEERMKAASAENERLQIEIERLRRGSR
jgi:hypothetical protein